jgi:hypothetical protein
LLLWLWLLLRETNSYRKCSNIASAAKGWNTFWNCVASHLLVCLLWLLLLLLLMLLWLLLLVLVLVVAVANLM